MGSLHVEIARSLKATNPIFGLVWACPSSFGQNVSSRAQTLVGAEHRNGFAALHTCMRPPVSVMSVAVTTRSNTFVTSRPPASIIWNVGCTENGVPPVETPRGNVRCRSAIGGPDTWKLLDSMMIWYLEKSATLREIELAGAAIA